MRRAVLLPLAFLLVAAPAAGAAYDPIGTGVTRLVLDKRFAGFLDRAGVRVTAEAGAAKHGRALVLPVAGGDLDPTIGQGEVEQQGSVVFSSHRHRLAVRRLVVKTTRSPLVAKVGGSQFRVATSMATSLRRRGFGTVFSAKELKLTAKVATRLNKKLRPRQQFAPGQLIGTLTTAAQPVVTVVLPTGRTTLVFDTDFVAKLDQHFVSLNPVFPAEHVGPTFTLPIIAGGALAPDASSGTLRTGGEIEFLQLGGGQVFWHELWFDLGLHIALAEVDVEPTPAFPGKLGQAPVLALGGGTVASEPAARTMALSGAALSLPDSTANVLNRAFADGKDDFKAGELLGALSFVAQGQ
jgi:hypothetical protein